MDLPKARLIASRARNGEGNRKLFQQRPINPNHNNKDQPSECALLNTCATVKQDSKMLDEPHAPRRAWGFPNSAGLQAA